jgi:hypothetical protein
LARNGPVISLADFAAGDDYIAAVRDWFAGRGEGVVLLNDWERMTPLWHAQLVDGWTPDPDDVRPLFVSTARPWLELVFDHLPGGPVYLNGYRPELVAAGFRLRPRGPFYQVVEPGDTTVPPELEPVASQRGQAELVAYLLPNEQVTAGDYVPLTLALRAPQGTADFYVPELRLGAVALPFTTDSHLVSPEWRPGEVIIERFDFALSHDLAAGQYPLTVRMLSLSSGGQAGPWLSLGTLEVSAQPHPIAIDHLLANFRQRVGLVSAVARQGLERREAPWSEPLLARPGESVHLTLRWQSLAPAEESYTVFVHLIDLGNQLVAPGPDYTPLGGAAPTHLWIPKWLPGQQLLDPYRLEVPTDLAPGTYQIEVGLYEMTGRRRLMIHDRAGNAVGDRFILGSVVVADE